MEATAGMEEGLYESLITTNSSRALSLITGLVADVGGVNEAEQPAVLARHVRDAVVRRLSSTSNEQVRIDLVNQLLTVLQLPDDAVDGNVRQLLSLSRPPAPGVVAMSTVRPSTPLSDAALLTNAHGEPSFGSELRSELDTADGVDLLCAFLKWQGIRVISAELERLRERGVPLRVITTTYIGATERLAIERLIDFGATVKINYDTLGTRLHAKAWLFKRRTDFDTAYVGSSNLSKQALLEGLEWNVRLSKVATPSLMEKFQATFETYWHNDSFEIYDPERDRDRLDDALTEASGRSPSKITVLLSGLEVRPYPYQVEMLEALEVEREVHGRHRNLIVAATGTGKTVVAALDYKALSEATTTTRPSLLFVAHRQEILRQAMQMYREVLGEGNFGELYVDGHRPERWRHVFASVQSLHSYGVQQIPADAFDIVVIDEFHHAEAKTYRDLLDHLAPHELLGMTATPERTDGSDVRAFFDGRTAYELRLWDALDQGLLCPFHYFGVADGTDLSRIQWTRGKYDTTALTGLYTGNDARARIVLKQVREKVGDVTGMRGLGFCVSVAHAFYMARVFNDSGIPALALSGETSTTERLQALADLREGRLKVLFTADLFNEGIDLPQVNTVLFLRPTESPTIFLQQLGRGLRRAANKAVLTVLDFVGLQNEKFRFDLRYRALTGSTRKGLERDINQGFPFLPSGSQIILDRVVQDAVLANLKGQVGGRWNSIVRELREQGDCTLGAFLAESGLEVADVARSGRSWTRLRREAGLPTRSGGDLEDALLKRVRAFAHVDDPDRAQAYLTLLSDRPRHYDNLDDEGQTFARMLFFLLYPGGGGFSDYAAGLSALHREPAVRDEMAALIELGVDRTRHLPSRLAGRLGGLPLRVHARYQREEILAALGHATPQRLPSYFREGVMRSDPMNLDAFFVTLRKAETDFSPTTMYQDYAISPTLFHWESQSTTASASPTGQRYIHQRANGSEVLIFSRESKLDALGTRAYTFLGTADYASHTGDRPMAVTWQLDRPMRADLFNQAKVAG
jgi:superfamily II DNA or RNA helicase